MPPFYLNVQLELGNSQKALLIKIVLFCECFQGLITRNGDVVNIEVIIPIIWINAIELNLEIICKKAAA